MKIAVIDTMGTVGTFGGYIGHLGENHEVTYVNEPITLSQARQLHNSHELVWYEWADNFFREAMRHPKECKIIVRLHSYEYFTEHPANAYWPNVDRLVTVSEEMRGLLGRAEYRLPLPPIDLLPNGTDLARFPFNPAKDYSGKKIAIMGWLNLKKNLPLALYLLDALPDKEFTLHLAGEWQDARIKLYLLDMISKMGLADRVVFHGRIPHDKLAGWLADKTYILSPSLFESFGQSLMEGMACGCLPLVHNFFGAEERFGDECCFTGVQAGVELLEFYAAIDETLKHDLARANLETAKKYDLALMFPRLDNIIEKATAMPKWWGEPC